LQGWQKMNKYWIGVVSKEHVKRGVKLGIAQVCHGKKAPLSRMRKGDWLIYYSPKMSFEGQEKCQAFTAIGKVKTGEVYQVEMAPGFCPYRIDVDYYPCREVPIADLLSDLQFAQGKNWGFMLRRGLFEIIPQDFTLIAKAMELCL
jgi:hypothetical protein